MDTKHLEFVEKLKIINSNITPLENYKGSKINILCKCEQCSYEWMVRPSNLLSGKGCPQCARNNSRKKHTKTHEVFIDELATKNSNVICLGKYSGAKTKISFRCKECTYEWNATPNHILEGHGCPNCGGSMKKTHEQFITELSKKTNNIIVIGKYKNSKSKLKCKCNICEYEWEVAPQKLLDGTGCPRCANRKNTSFPEQSIYYYLSKIYSDCENRYYNNEYKFELDIYIQSLKLGIEYDGVYWHSNKQKKDEDKFELCKNLALN